MKKTGKKTVKGGRRASPSVAERAVKPIQLPDGMWERISRKAYELWEERGRQEGSALRNWLDAEEIVIKELHESCE